MVVQHILAVRRAKREVKIVPEVSVENPENAEKEVIDTKTEPETPNDKNGEESVESKIEEINNTEMNADTKKLEEKEEEETEDIAQVDSTTEKEHNENKTETKTEVVDVEEYFVKYRNFSYLHCEWKTEEELRRGDRRIFSKIKRFQQKMANNVNIFEYVSYAMI